MPQRSASQSPEDTVEHDRIARRRNAFQTPLSFYPRSICCQRRRCLAHSGWATMGRTCRSTIGARPSLTQGRLRMAFWMSGARCKRFMICVTRARITWPSSASSVDLATKDFRHASFDYRITCSQPAPAAYLFIGRENGDPSFHVRARRPSHRFHAAHPAWRRLPRASVRCRHSMQCHG